MSFNQTSAAKKAKIMRERKADKVKYNEDKLTNSACNILKSVEDRMNSRAAENDSDIAFGKVVALELKSFVSTQLKEQTKIKILQILYDANFGIPVSTNFASTNNPFCSTWQQSASQSFQRQVNSVTTHAETPYNATFLATPSSHFYTPVTRCSSMFQESPATEPYTITDLCNISGDDAVGLLNSSLGYNFNKT